MSNEQLSLQDRIAALEARQEENVPASEVRELITAVKDLFEGKFDGEDVQLYGELGDLARYINNARKELRDFQPHNLAEHDIPDASDQLDAIVIQTEQATGKIMDSCEAMEGINQRVRDRLEAIDPPLDPDVLAGVDDAIGEAQIHITNIFEACNFQDITGQRIMKVVETLREIERHVLRMVLVFGLTHKADELDEETKKEFMTDADLLNGPQLPEQSLEQDDIDDILDKLL